MHDYVINCVNPRTGERRPAVLALNDIQLAQAKRCDLRELTPKMRAAIPDGFMPCDESFASP